MDTCFECGGKLKMVAKAGRMAMNLEDEEDDELYEIPFELKISSCAACGWMFDEEVWIKIQRAVESQRKCAPGIRVELLRHTDKFIRNVVERPRMFGDSYSVEATILTALNIRTAIVDKGKTKDQTRLNKEYQKFLKVQFPKMGNTNAEFHALDLENEFAPMLRMFCDVWINAVM